MKMCLPLVVWFVLFSNTVSVKPWTTPYNPYHTNVYKTKPCIHMIQTHQCLLHFIIMLIACYVRVTIYTLIHSILRHALRVQTRRHQVYKASRQQHPIEHAIECSVDWIELVDLCVFVMCVCLQARVRCRAHTAPHKWYVIRCVSAWWCHRGVLWNTAIVSLNLTQIAHQQRLMTRARARLLNAYAHTVFIRTPVFIRTRYLKWCQVIELTRFKQFRSATCNNVLIVWIVRS